MMGNRLMSIILVGVRHNTKDSKKKVIQIVNNYLSLPNVHFALELNPIDAHFILRREWVKSEFFYPIK